MAGVKVANRKTARVLNEIRCFEPIRISERRVIAPGDVVKINGERGEFTFLHRDIRDGSLTFWGGDRNPLGRRAFRSFMPDRVKTIRRTTT